MFLPEEGAIQILRPPPEFRPSPDFDRLLVEYRTWIKANHKKGFDAFTAFSREKLTQGEALWDIRGNLRPNQNFHAISSREKIFKWNLMLHLAQEVEDQGREADRLLEDLRKRSSPLRDLLQEQAGAVHPLEDLDHFDKESSGKNLDQVLEAWISLFEAQVEGDDLLLTFSGEIFDRLGVKWEERGGEAYSPMTELELPDFSHLSLGELAEAKSRFLESEEGTALRNSVRKLREKVAGRDREEELSLQTFPHKTMKIILRRFPPVPVLSGPLCRYSGKTVGLFKVGLLKEELSDDR